jgi:hypothetical protein
VNRRLVFLSLAVLLGVGLMAAFLGPRGPEEFPLAELVPADALFYAGFPDYHRFEELVTRLPGAWREEDRKRFDQAKPHLSGAVAVYVDSKGEWVWLGRLTRASALASGALVEGDAAVVATPAALERRRTRAGALLELPDFRRLKSPFFLNLGALGMKGPLGDFTAAGFRLDGGPPWTLRGRAIYRPAVYRLHLEGYVRLPRGAGASAAGPPVQIAMTDPFLRLWDDFLETLEAEDRDRVDRECMSLRREVPGGQDPRDVLRRLGPRWGIALTPAPALLAWVELPDLSTGETLGRMIERAASDAVGQARGQGQAPPFELEKMGSAWRLKVPWAASLRLGEAFTPALAITKDRVVLSTCASVLEAPPATTGGSHLDLSIRVAPTLDLARALVPFITDGAFRSEARGIAYARHLREHGPLGLGELQRKYPDRYERAKHLEEQRAEFMADALAELSRTERYQTERARVEQSIAGWSERLSGLDRVSGSGSFTDEGLEFELRGESGPR